MKKRITELSELFRISCKNCGMILCTVDIGDRAELRVCDLTIYCMRCGHINRIIDTKSRSGFGYEMYQSSKSKSRHQ